MIGMLPGRPVDEDLAAEIREFRSPSDSETRMFYEIVIAPGYTEAGLAKLKGKSKTLRILEAKPRAPSGRSLRQVAGACFCTVLFATEPWMYVSLFVRRGGCQAAGGKQSLAHTACPSEVSQTPAHGTDGRYWAQIIYITRPCVMRCGLHESKRCSLHPQAEVLVLHGRCLLSDLWPCPPNLHTAQSGRLLYLCAVPSSREKGKEKAEPCPPCLQLATGFHFVSSSKVLSYHAFACPACSWLAVPAG